jgi:hypothetical protein
MIERIALALTYCIFYPAMRLHTWIFSPKRAPEVPPAEGRPYIPVHVKLHIVTPDRPELMQNVWAGKNIDRICWELSEGIHG